MKIIVHSGVNIENLAIKELHPVSAVNYVNNLITNERLSDVIEHKIYTNNSDLVSAVKYLGELHNVQTEFFLNGISHGNDIEPLFADFNRALDLLSEIYEQKPSSLIVDIETNKDEIIVVDKTDEIIENNEGFGQNSVKKPKSTFGRLLEQIFTKMKFVNNANDSVKNSTTNVSNLDNNEG